MRGAYLLLPTSMTIEGCWRALTSSRHGSPRWSLRVDRHGRCELSLRRRSHGGVQRVRASNASAQVDHPHWRV